MSSLIKSRSIVLGDPLEIKTEDLTVENGCPEEEAPGQPAVEDGTWEEALGILENARERAAQIITRAEEKSREIYERAKQEGYEKGYEEGYEEGERKGFADGHDRGRQQGLATVDEIMEEAVEIRRRALETKERMVREAEAEVVRIVIEIAKKVLGEQVKTDREAVLGLVRKALEKCTYTNSVTLKVSPDDYDVVVSYKKKLLAEAEGITQLDIEAEETMSRGSCLIETNAGVIDAGIEAQMTRIEHIFKELTSYE
ncbi:MAG TPA: FliH/SctL family protein [Clostridia bacterium]|nr:FliH/SctL family protein [Clostridia bacterium]